MRPLAIVVPVFNGVEHLRRCLESIRRCAPHEATVVLHDDASTDPAVGPELSRFEAAMPHATVIRANANGGFIRACNAGALAAPAGADLLFLNADTELTRGAIEEMAAVLEATGASVCCPLSSNATILSVPRFQQANELPPGWSAEDMAAYVREAAGEVRAVAIPTPVGFCMLVRREAWEAHGPFDTAYGMGYGEEDDLGQKLQAAGGRIVAALRAYVWHQGAVSFGVSDAVRERRAANGRLLLSRWPSYAEGVRAFAQANPLRAMQERLWHALLSAPERRPRHVVHLVPRWELQGALRDSVLEAARAAKVQANHTVLVPTPDRGAWLDAIDFEVEPGIRVTGLIDLPARLGRFLAASPATEARVHVAREWDTAAVLEAVRERRLPVAVG
jgi:GT2 family glycosyltransferase